MLQRALSECLSRRGGNDVNHKCHSVQAANVLNGLAKETNNVKDER